LRQTGTAAAPWHIVEATNRRYRELETGRILLEAMHSALKQAAARKAAKAPAGPAPAASRTANVLKSVNLSPRLSDTGYEKRMDVLQSELTRLTWAARAKGVSTIALFEGWDAAGKGGAIRRVVGSIDPRLLRVVPIAAPTDEERAHHYLWRFWRHLPRAGRMVLFDRSWYGRVLVERVEGFAREDEWRRAYHEINDFEEQLAGHGCVLAKFWIHLSQAEQLRRFQARARTPFKHYKITEEDWRNRQRWPDYEEAINEMVARTSTEYSPWTLIAGNDKRVARIQVLSDLVGKLQRAIDG
jgi:polyphosphate kinase 2 (PPK2 family)